MVEKYSATQTQVATKVSTKTKVLLGLMIAGCLGGMFAIASMSFSKPKKVTRFTSTIKELNSVPRKVAGIGEQNTGWVDGQEIMTSNSGGGGVKVCGCYSVIMGWNSCSCTNPSTCRYGYYDTAGVYHNVGFTNCIEYTVYPNGTVTWER